MCVSLSVATVYAVGQANLDIAADSKVGPTLQMKFGFGAQIVVGLPVVGNVSVLYMVGVEIYTDSTQLNVSAFLMCQGHAELIGGLVSRHDHDRGKGTIQARSERPHRSRSAGHLRHRHQHLLRHRHRLQHELERTTTDRLTNGSQLAAFPFSRFRSGSMAGRFALNIVVLPRNQNPLVPAIEATPPIPDAPAFADAQLVFEARLVGSLAAFPNNHSLGSTVAAPVAQPANARPLFEALRRAVQDHAHAEQHHDCAASARSPDD